jgi:hypothetical protein
MQQRAIDLESEGRISMDVESIAQVVTQTVRSIAFHIHKSLLNSVRDSSFVPNRLAVRSFHLAIFDRDMCGGTDVGRSNLC